MVYYCFVNNCNSTTYCRKNKSDTECITWHGLPTSTAVQERWANALGVEIIPKSSRICSKHFAPHCFERIGLSKRRLKTNSVPTLFVQSKSKSYSGALQEIATANTSNISKKENNTVPFEPPVKRSKPNSVPPCPQLTPERTSQQVIRPNTLAIKEEESNVAVPETPESHIIHKIRYPGDISERKISKMSRQSIVQSMRILKQACLNKDRRIKRLQRTQRGQKRKIETLQQLLSDLRKSDLISSNPHDVLEAMSPDDCNTAKDIERGKVRGKYPPHLRSFALTLHFYSLRAYNYVRQVYQNKLPTPSTIRAWYRSTDGSPDEMAIRKQAERNHSVKRFVGYVDCGTMIPEPDHLPLAKDALVYLITGVNERWKIPVAYFLVHGLTARERAEITKQVLIAIAATSILVIALTFDGLPVNIAMCSDMGADVYNNKPSFVHPAKEDFKVRIIFDAAHMLKLIRNAFASKGILYDGQNNPIEWKYKRPLSAI